ncbi:MAG TPA: hypothetical protein VNA26_00290, partial [Chitinophagaceae bacterium]|nr:hypothetical protein [Chitinophagaceae bacterium]
VNVKTLSRIAGVGTSPLIHYDGTGAYFLDKLEEGVWRLEVMPDVIYIRDPFERASPKKEVTAIKWVTNQMQINLDDLGAEFSIKGLNEGNNVSASANNYISRISPGAYLLTRKGISFSAKKNAIGAIGLNEFVAPPSSQTEIVVRHIPFPEVSAAKPFTISAIISGVDTGRVSVQLNKLGGALFRNIPMKKTGYEYAAEVPADIVTSGQLQYRIIIQEGSNYAIYPGNIKSNPFAWDNYQFDNYKTNVAAENSSLELYNASTDQTIHVLPHSRRGFQTSYISGPNTGSLVFKLAITETRQNEIMGFQTFIGDKIKPRVSEANTFDKVILRARATAPLGMKVKILLVDKHGSGFSSTVSVTDHFQDIELPFTALKNDAALLLPRPYPEFQPLYFKSSAKNEKFSLSDMGKIEITTGPSFNSSIDKTYSLEIESVKLGKIK